MTYRSFADGPRPWRTASAVCLVILLAGVVAWAKERGSVHGTVVTIESDGVRSVIPGAAVTLEGSEVSRTATADERGAYAFIDIPDGNYEVRAASPGLTGSTSAAIKSGESLELDIVMSLEAR